jgi:hypothetical protein
MHPRLWRPRGLRVPQAVRLGEMHADEIEIDASARHVIREVLADT